MGEWISVEDGLPEYDEPVLICISGITQNIVYIRDGAEVTPDWFEPFFFEHDDEAKVFWNKVSHWMPLPEPPRSKDDE